MLTLLATQCSLYFGINIRINKFIAYIYIPFSQKLDENFCICAKIEAIKYLHAIFLLTAEQRDVQSGLQSHVYFDVTDVARLDVVTFQ